MSTVSIGTQPSKHASLWLDALRGLAALGVFASHWRDCLFQDYSQLHTHTLLSAAAYFASGLGHQWVVVFFVLSGYLVGGSVLRQVTQQRWSWREYALNRLTRLYIVLIPALLLGDLIDLAGLRFFGASDVYTAHHGMRLMVAAPSSHLSLTALFGNYLFLQGILVPVFGTNGPLWSLSYEFWYYVAFPMLFFALWKRTSLVGRVLNLAGLCAVLVFVGWKISAMGLIWLMGVGIHWLPAVPHFSKPLRVVGLSSVIVLTLGCLACCKGSHSAFSDYILGIAIVLMVYGILHWTTDSPSGWVRGIIQYSAKSSYTLYLVHLPFLLLLTAWIGQARWEPTPRTVFYATLVFLIVLTYVHTVYLLFEKHTDEVRLWLRSSLHRSSPRSERMSSTEVIRAA